MRLPSVACARAKACRVLVSGLFGLVAVTGCTSRPDASAQASADARAASATGGTRARTPTPWPAAVPHVDTLPDDAHGRLVRRGRALLAATRDSLPAQVGNALRCTSCHLDDGRRANALPWVGVLARFPQYRARNAQVNQIEDRVNDCLERSMAGRALPHDSDAMRAIVAYFAYLSRGVPMGTRLEGQGAPAITAAPSGEREDGALVYARTCARCHGAEGEGTPTAPPVWGARSYSIGAGMGRPRTAAAFIRANMPHDQPPDTVTLSESEALAVATYINAQTRPDFARRAGDWPFGGAPADVPYDTPGRTAARAAGR